MIDIRISDIFIYRTASLSSQTFLLSFVYQEKLSALNISSTRRHKNMKKITHIHRWQIPNIVWEE